MHEIQNIILRLSYRLWNPPCWVIHQVAGCVGPDICIGSWGIFIPLIPRAPRINVHLPTRIDLNVQPETLLWFGVTPQNCKQNNWGNRAVQVIVESNVTQFPYSKIHRVDISKTSIYQIRVGSMCNRCRFEAACCLGKWQWSPFLQVAEDVSTDISVNDLRKQYLSFSCSLMISNKICVPLTCQPCVIV